MGFFKHEAHEVHECECWAAGIRDLRALRVSNLLRSRLARGETRVGFALVPLWFKGLAVAVMLATATGIWFYQTRTRASGFSTYLPVGFTSKVEYQA